jgi:hypothetical protein
MKIFLLRGVRGPIGFVLSERYWPAGVESFEQAKPRGRVCNNELLFPRIKSRGTSTQEFGPSLIAEAEKGRLIVTSMSRPFQIF